jgi:hypothetical protein
MSVQYVEKHLLMHTSVSKQSYETQHLRFAQRYRDYGIRRKRLREYWSPNAVESNEGVLILMGKRYRRRQRGQGRRRECDMQMARLPQFVVRVR